MKLRSTLMLFLMVLLVGGSIWYLEYYVAGPHERKELARHALQVDPDSVSYLQIETSNYLFACRRSGGEWRIDKPIEGFADPGSIKRILTGLKQIPKEEIITPEQWTQRGFRLHDYGLELPRAKIVFHQGREKRAILVGDQSVVGDYVYIMATNREEVIATSASLLDYIPDTFETIRSRKLMHDAPTGLTRIEIKRPGGFLLLVFDPEQGWMLQQPVAGRAGQAFVMDLITKMFTAEISRFVEDNVSDFTPYGLDAPVARVSMWPVGSGSVRTVYIGREDPSDSKLVYAHVDDESSVVGIAKQLLLDISLDVNIFRDRRLLNIVPVRVGYIKMMEGDRVLELSKDDAGSWSLSRPFKRAADSSLVWDMMAGWVSSRVESFVADSVTNLVDIGLSDPVRTIVLATRSPVDENEEAEIEPLEEGRHMTSFHIYAHPDDSSRVYVKLAHEDTLVTVAASPFLGPQLDPLWLYNRTALQLVPGDVRKIELRRGNVFQVVQVEENGLFRPGIGQDGELVQGVVDNILAEVSGLRVDRFMTEEAEDLAEFGLDNAVATLTLGLSGGAGISKTLAFGSEVDDPKGVYAMIRGQDAVFVLPLSTRDRLLSDLLVVPESITEEFLAPEEAKSIIP